MSYVYYLISSAILLCWPSVWFFGFFKKTLQLFPDNGIMFLGFQYLIIFGFRRWDIHSFPRLPLNSPEFDFVRYSVLSSFCFGKQIAMPKITGIIINIKFMFIPIFTLLWTYNYWFHVLLILQWRKKRTRSF